MLETLNKLLCTMLLRRVAPCFPRQPEQMGGLRNCQALDALMTATSRLEYESKTSQYSVWASLDIEAAFDSIQHQELADYLVQQAGEKHPQEVAHLLRIITSPTMHASFRGRTWTQTQKRGVQQGGSHSSFVFSCMLAWIIAQRMQTWTEWGHATLHQGFGIVYIDDILLNFISWEQADQLLADLSTHMAKYGLKVNWKKSTIMSTASVLEQGRVTVSEHSVLRSCLWSSTLRYLRRELQHPNPEYDLTSQLLNQVSGVLHLAVEQLAEVAKLQHWTRPLQATQFASRYIAARFQWLSPMFETLQVHISRVNAMQTTCLVFLLKLYLPQELSKTLALELNRFRRRVAKIVGVRYSVSWVTTWVTRRWNYLGHVLRFEDEHITRLALEHVHHSKGRGGPKQTLLTWASKEAAAACHMGGTVTLSELEGLASDKAVWQSGITSVQRRHEPQTSLYNPSLWAKPLRVFTLPVMWMQALLLTSSHDGSFAVHWVSTEYGLMHYPLPDFSYIQVVQFFRHLQMSCSAIAFPTFVTISLQELLVLEADSTASRIFSELGVCWLFEVLSEPQYAELLHRLAE